MSGRGVEMLDYSLSQIRKQKSNLTELEIVISDDSENNLIFDYVNSVKDLNIKYVKNERGHGLAQNINNALLNSSGDIIHIMCQDDYFSDKDSLQKIVDIFDKEMGWMVCSYMHSTDRVGLFRQQIPSWNDKIYFENTIGTPSCLTLVNQDILLLDENLSWFVDCEYYYRLYKKYGQPKILKYFIFTQLLWEGQTTKTVTQELVDKEVKYIQEKYVGEIV